jgi:hypothetical protein
LQPELFDESPRTAAKALASPFSMFAGSLSPLISNSPGIGKSPAGAGSSIHELKLYVELFFLQQSLLTFLLLKWFLYSIAVQLSGFQHRGRAG